ncbi:MAG: AAC(3) family N-acetyltransferase [Brumimicrobium sp.]
MIKINSNIPFEELAFHLDLQQDDMVFISSDLKQLAVREKKIGKSLDINKFIDNFQQVLKEGTIVIPAYTDGLTKNDIFDYNKSRPVVGALPNRVFKRKDFVRSFDPLHSVFVWGKEKEELLKYDDTSTFGEKSVFHFLHKKNATFIFIDIHPQETFTYVHFIEEQEKVPYRAYKNFTIQYNKGDEKSSRDVHFYTKKKGVLSNIYNLVNDFFKQGAMKRFEYDNIYIDKIKAHSATEIMKQHLSKKQYFYTFSWNRYFRDLIKSFLGRD